jgi:hypothetical protein
MIITKQNSGTPLDSNQDDLRINVKETKRECSPFIVRMLEKVAM